MLTAIASTDGATPGKIISAEPINKIFRSDFHIAAYMENIIS